MNAASYPALFQAFDSASKRAQKIYLRLFRGTLLLLIFGAVLGSFSVKLTGWHQASGILSAALIAISLILSAALKIASPEKTWFAARAVAESTKSLSWRYMVGAEPYGVDMPPQAADSQFADDLHSILQERRHLAGRYGAGPADRPQISPEMVALRAQSTEDRRSLYLRERIRDQRTWYSSNADQSDKLHTRWFWIATVFQAAALISAIFMIALGDVPMNPTGACAAVATAAMAWLQMKRYQDLAQAYALAAFELGLIEVQGQHVHTEAEFSKFVANAENAISREHTMWIARRDVA
jgi:SMODS and SLOG-associating 2TM effector domain 3/SMODS and SLOG-associating 2TM effector domain 1